MGNKKVFVSGCYDMLHSGHVAFFEEAARYGDLYVGIGSDKTIFELKARKTINTDAERLYMVLCLYVRQRCCEKNAAFPTGSIWPEDGSISLMSVNIIRVRY